MLIVAHSFFVWYNSVMQNAEYFMNKAIEQAKKALAKDEVPIGAVVVQNGKIVGRGYNKREQNRNAVDHAEVIAISRACKKLNDWRLENCTLFVTLEPCMMCMGACLNARIGEVVFGAFDPNGKKVIQQKISALNHNMNVLGGILEDKCKSLLQQFFKQKRK